MKISVIMAACNQGNFLQETVVSLQEGLQGCKDWEIIIIDDQSTDGCCDKVEQTDRIKVHRPDTKLGVIHARHLAGSMTTGDVIMTTDTHCYYPRRSIWRIANWTVRQRAIFLPKVRLERGPDAYHTVCGGKIVISDRGLRMDRPTTVRQWPALFGSIYIMSREVWETMGGWVQLPGYWGGEEVLNTILAYRFGIPIVVLDHHECTHRKYREHGVYPFDLPAHHPCEIAHFIHAACFPDTYEEVWKPLIRYYYSQWLPTADPSTLRDWIATKAVWDEHRFFKTVLGHGTEELRKHPVIQRVAVLQQARDNPRRPREPVVGGKEQPDVIPVERESSSIHPNEPQPVAPEHQHRRRHRRRRA